jgi:N-acetylmuramic acid 6-phosphate etherase
MLKTETPAQDHALLDQYPTAELVNVLVDDQFNAVKAVRAAAPRIAAAVTAACRAWKRAGA